MTVSNLTLSSRVELLKPSPTLAITAKAASMKAEGIDVISFGAGEPDFNTPGPVCEAAIDAIHSGFTKYTPSSGTKDLKEAICEKLERENNLKYSPDQIVVSCGAKQSVYNSMQILLSPGDEVILLAPYWMTYADQIRLAGGVPVVIHTTVENDFIPTYEQLQSAVSAKTKAILINSPSNPTGAVLPRQTLKEIAALAIRHGLWIVADEIYERLVYGVTAESIGTLSSEVYEQTITIGGCSKTYAMTGWRIGFAAAPVRVAKSMSNLQDQVTSNPTSFAQVGAATAFRLPGSVVDDMRNEFQARRDLIVGLLRGIPGVKMNEPKGAFYAFPDFSEPIQSLGFDGDPSFAAWLLESAHVAVVPGSVFEGVGHIRLSYATSRKNIELGVARIAEALVKRNA